MGEYVSLVGKSKPTVFFQKYFFSVEDKKPGLFYLCAFRWFNMLMDKIQYLSSIVPTMILLDEDHELYARRVLYKNWLLFFNIISNIENIPTEFSEEQKKVVDDFFLRMVRSKVVIHAAIYIILGNLLEKGFTITIPTGCGKVSKQIHKIIRYHEQYGPELPNPYVCDIFGRFPLHYAVKTNNKIVILIYLNRRVDPNQITLGIPARTYPGNTPLWYCRDPSIVEILIQYGAKVNEPNYFGETPLLFTNVKVSKALIEKGADVNATFKGSHTPLSKSINEGNVGKTLLLLCSGADVLSLGHFCDTPNANDWTLTFQSGKSVNVLDMIHKKYNSEVKIKKIIMMAGIKKNSDSILFILNSYDSAIQKIIDFI